MKQNHVSLKDMLEFCTKSREREKNVFRVWPHMFCICHLRSNDVVAELDHKSCSKEVLMSLIVTHILQERYVVVRECQVEKLICRNICLS